MSTTQDHLSITDIVDDIVLLKSGGSALVLKTGAVNFGLLSEREQLAIIASFGQMLNSLSFPIQIVLRSTRLNISSYITLLDKAQLKQNNPLLSEMIAKYRSFIQNIVKENEVLDKQFYIVAPVSYLEMGIKMLNSSERLLRAKTILLPRRDQIIKQLGRIGLKATQLDSKQLVELFFEIYNTPTEQSDIEVEQVRLTQPQKPVNVNPQSLPQQSPPVRQMADGSNKSHPFVVEELEEN